MDKQKIWQYFVYIVATITIILLWLNGFASASNIPIPQNPTHTQIVNSNILVFLSWLKVVLEIMMITVIAILIGNPAEANKEIITPLIKLFIKKTENQSK